jgi:hypothetical protein
VSADDSGYDAVVNRPLFQFTRRFFEPQAYFRTHRFQLFTNEGRFDQRVVEEPINFVADT